MKTVRGSTPAMPGPTARLAVPLDGAELQGEQRGQHPAAVFVHGFGGDLHDWDRLWSHLGEDLQKIRYDLRGFGQSQQSGSEPFSHVEDLLALLDTAGIERADLIGMSMGGSIALGFALDYPDRVRRLVLISPGIMGWEWSDEWRSMWRTITTAARAGDLSQARELWWQHPLFDTARESDAASELHASIGRYSCAQWIRDTQRMVMPDVDRLPSLTPPILLLTGGLDLADFRLAADIIEGAAPQVERVDYPSCGHMLPLEAPTQIGERIRTFLA